MSITLTPETENRLREQAERIGEDADTLAEAIIIEGLSHDLPTGAPNDRTDEEIAEIRAAIQRRLEEVETGCIKMRAQAVANSRLRLGFPSFWGSGTDGISCGIS